MTDSDSDSDRREGAIISAREMIEAALIHLVNAAGTLEADAADLDRVRLLRAQADLQLFVGDLAGLVR